MEGKPYLIAKFIDEHSYRVQWFVSVTSHSCSEELSEKYVKLNFWTHLRRNCQINLNILHEDMMKKKHNNSTTNIIINHYIVQLPGGRKLGNFYKSFEDFRKIIEIARMPQNTWKIDNIEQNNSSLLFAQNLHQNTLFTIVSS